MSLKIDVSSFLKNASFSLKKTLSLNSKSTTLICCSGQHKKSLEKEIKPYLASYQVSEFKSHNEGNLSLQTSKGKVIIIFYKEKDPESLSNHEGLLEQSIYAQTRDSLGEAICQLDHSQTLQLQLYLFEPDYEATVGALTGLEMAMYRYHKPSAISSLKIYGIGLPSKDALDEAIQSASQIGKAINIARFLVDSPPNLKKPADYAHAIKQLLPKRKDVVIDIWDSKKLKEEKMNLLLSVGQGADQEAHLVHIKYRPSKLKAPMQPIAFVGKGITFDSGGLDIKPSSGMRLMKKDMGGSATLVGLASWVIESKLQVPCDFYFSLAENAISAKSFRPSDIIEARNGLKVEIDNTDAEGRLAMADALSLATEKKGDDKPMYIIDIATLTGAVKVGLGSDIGGLFSTDDDLAFLIYDVPLRSSVRYPLGGNGTARARMFNVLSNVFLISL